ncbi:MAG: UvrD-helicase domain-containing protein [Oscillibacter sp.]|nr:UvrD-helicase domain-containing protein [Oscillibacter sp.]
MSDFEERYRAARRRVIETDLRRLNPMQRKAAMTTEGPLLLLAGAGSGKTTVLIQRVYTLLTYGRGADADEIPEWAATDDLEFLEAFPEQPDEAQFERARRLCAVDPPRPWEIIAITFTNKAAGELKERLAARLGEAGNDVWASTFHSACVRILRRYIERIGFERDFTIYDTDDSQRVLKEVVKELNLDAKSFAPRSVLSEIGGAKDWYLSPEEYAKEYASEKDWRKNRIAKIYAAYQKRLRASNALDFDDILFHTVTLLKQEPDVLEHYQRQFRYVLVDEYQDTNHIQDVLTSLLAGGRRNLCVVGDDDQSIYSFRGANIENILGFEKRYPDAQIIRLEQNYRSTQNILDAANAVIENNRGRKGKTLWTDNGRGEGVQIRTVSDENEEASFIVDDILSGSERGRDFRDSAVLYRMNAQSNAIEYALKRNGVPYRVIGGMKFFDRAEVKDMLAYLCVVNNRTDDLRFRRIANNPPRGIGNTTLAKVSALAESQGLSLYETFRNADIFPELKSVKAKLLKFADLLDELHKQSEELPLAEFYDLLCEKSGYAKALEDKRDEESKGRLENVRELKSAIAGFVERSPTDATLSGFLNETALYTDLDSAEFGDNCVTLMTIHAAKGLEFPVVYVAGMEEGIFPNNNALYQEKSLEEERRLCYVAMTRAKERLILINASQRLLYGETRSNPPSRFLKEIPEELARRTGKRSWNSYGSAARYGGSAAKDAGTVVRKYKITQEELELVAKRRRGETAKAPSMPEGLRLQPGDLVEHTAFGKGIVVSVTPMSRDTLVEIRFDTAGVKKLMLNYVKDRMKKL